MNHLGLVSFVAPHFGCMLGGSVSKTKNSFDTSFGGFNLLVGAGALRTAVGSNKRKRRAAICFFIELPYLGESAVEDYANRQSKTFLYVKDYS